MERKSREDLERHLKQKKQEAKKLDEKLSHVESEIEDAEEDLKLLLREERGKELVEIKNYISIQEGNPQFRWDKYDVIFTKEEVAKVDKFMLESEPRDVGAIGGRYTFTIIPTSLGEVITVSDEEREETIRGL